ncbi:PKD domain-containing protein [Solirubrobacter phytolaccae]|uniref:PKD domain-containing protein n=1 Tax=Solirubrobacter phytolaccae TaxID=1404360 RepID=A0A9X3NDH3_9ACTN|nr:PKD domain-containing protein [Solirubrobacter phytolaccae]MDA0182857.1 PKD domain-containing protein [Solirubrobacter phytolaccae]
MLRLCLTAALLTLTLTASAQAEVVVAGTGEPAFTNSANNTQWVEWSNNGNYRVEFQHIVNGGPALVDGPYGVAQKGTTSVNWTGIPGVATPLQEGSTYGICGFGRWQDAYGMWYPDFQTSCANGKRTATTIDRTKPTIALVAPAFAREAKSPLTINYEDNLAYPFGVAFVSVDTPQLTVLPGCAPIAQTKVTKFECVATLPDADGPHQVCAAVPDAAVPDNPNSSDQSGTATSANRSDTKCATVTLDRAAPVVKLAGPDELQVGHAGLFTAQATDATSGIATTSGFGWGDGSSTAGLDASHAFANPGTYRLRFSATDAAGNTTEVTKDVKVTAAPSTPTIPTTPPVPTGSPSPGATPVPGTPTPAPVPSKLTVKVGKVTKTALRAQITGATGSVRVTLRRGRTVVATKRLTIANGQVNLKLPRSLVAGKHALEVVAGDRIATTSIKLAGKKAGAKGSRVDPQGQRPKLP